jgi:sugar phosphate permease
MPLYYQLGAIAGLLVTGVAADLFLRKQRFLLLFILNTMLMLWDVYLFVDASSA